MVHKEVEKKNGVRVVHPSASFIHHHLLEGLAEVATEHVTPLMTSNLGFQLGEDDRSLSAERSNGKLGEEKNSSRVSEKESQKRKAEDGQKRDEDGSNTVNVSSSAEFPRKKPSLASSAAQGGN